ncbi:MAG: hypothetical protein M3500_11570 [Actinomycetota bacterium]|nr:hypothetical protein [Actinomycetota bacterium]
MRSTRYIADRRRSPVSGSVRPPRSALPAPDDLTRRCRDLVAEMARQRANRHAAPQRSDDIRDPIGADPATYLNVGQEIAATLTPWLDVACGLEPVREA